MERINYGQEGFMICLLISGGFTVKLRRPRDKIISEFSSWTIERIYHDFSVVFNINSFRQKNREIRSDIEKVKKYMRNLMIETIENQIQLNIEKDDECYITTYKKKDENIVYDKEKIIENGVSFYNSIKMIARNDELIDLNFEMFIEKMKEIKEHDNIDELFDDVVDGESLEMMNNNNINNNSNINNEYEHEHECEYDNNDNEMEVIEENDETEPTQKTKKSMKNGKKEDKTKKSRKAKGDTENDQQKLSKSGNQSELNLANEGFLAKLLLENGCQLTYSQPSKVKAKANIGLYTLINIHYNGKCLFDKQTIVRELKEFLTNEMGGKYLKNLMYYVMRQTQNLMVDILIKMFGLNIELCPQTKNEVQFVEPKKTVMKYIGKDKTYVRKELVECGFSFYKRLDEYFQEHKEYQIEYKDISHLLIDL